MKTILVFAATAALGLSACSGANEEAAEKAGEAQVEMVEEQTDAMEDAGTMTDAEADAAVAATEMEAEAMEAQGEAIDNGAMAPAAPASTPAM